MQRMRQLYLIVRGFHRTFATGAACQQRTLTPPDTWFCPIRDLQMFFCWDHWPSSIHATTNSQPFSRFDFLLNLTLLNIGFHGVSATGVACWQGTLTPPDTWSCPNLGLACVLMSTPLSPELVLCSDFWISNTPRYFSFPYYHLKFYLIPRRFHRICNGCDKQTEDAHYSGHLVLSHFGTCKCSNVETNLPWTCLVSGLLSFEHPFVLLFYFYCLSVILWFLRGSENNKPFPQKSAWIFSYPFLWQNLIAISFEPYKRLHTWHIYHTHLVKPLQFTLM